MLKRLAGIDMTHVPYKGAGPAVQDIMAGHATTGLHDLAAVGALVRSGKLVALAVTGLSAGRCSQTYRLSPNRATRSTS